jgi:hypothetical protein
MLKAIVDDICRTVEQRLPRKGGESFLKLTRGRVWMSMWTGSVRRRHKRPGTNDSGSVPPIARARMHDNGGAKARV